MTTLSMPSVYEHREPFAQSSALLLGIVLALAISHLDVKHEAPSLDTPMVVSLSEPEPEAPAPQSAAELPRPFQPPPKAQPALGAPQPQRALTPVEATAAPQAQPSSVVIPEAPASPAVKAMPKAEEVVTPPIQRNPGAEGRFAQNVRAEIERKKIFPDSARDLGMSGAVEVVYVLDRMGTLLRSEIAATSGFPLLDQAALRAVRSARFSAWPEDAWVGESQKEFRTKLVFSIVY